LTDKFHKLIIHKKHKIAHAYSYNPDNKVREYLQETINFRAMSEVFFAFSHTALHSKRDAVCFFVFIYTNTYNFRK
jgi:hypothetical protein